MSFLNKIGYSLYKSVGDDYDEMLDDLLSKTDNDAAILRLVFFTAVDNNNDYKNKLSILERKVSEYFNSRKPVVTLVAQNPLDADLILEVHSYTPSEGDKVEYKSYNGYTYVLVTGEYGKSLYAGGLQSDIDADILTQSKKVFGTLGDILKFEGFPIDSIVRQWNYIERITDFDSDGNQHYQMFNNARSDFYSSVEWARGYPAATGIGTFGGGVLIDFDAVMPVNNILKVVPIDNKLQVAAHAYSEKVLEKASSGLSTPKFERAKCLEYKSNKLIYISGTAAIRGEESLSEHNILSHLNVTLENIRQLTGDSELKLLRVYLKAPSFYDKVNEAMSVMPDLMVSYLLANVCRDELLIEIEGISFK